MFERSKTNIDEIPRFDEHQTHCSIIYKSRSQGQDRTWWRCLMHSFVVVGITFYDILQSESSADYLAQFHPGLIV